MLTLLKSPRKHSEVREVLGLFVNTLTANDTYSLNYRENFWQPIQMQLSRKKIFFQFEIYTKFGTFCKKITLTDYVFLKLRTAKDVVRSMSKKTRFRTSFHSQLAKLCQTLLKYARQTCIIFFIFGVRKCLF